MKLYPALRARMGAWTYYIVRMKMRDVANEVQFAHDIYTDNTLSEAIQRTLGEKRVKNEIVGYLTKSPERFFSSIVVAALEGSPHWHPVEMDTNTVPAVFMADNTLQESFGVLAFGDDPKYYALDGQHRVAAIKALIRRHDDAVPPEGFQDEFLSVIIILRDEHDMSNDEWRQGYRRLFSSLNRYAKGTGKDTNIIMDEDDRFAITTRRLITDHSFFSTTEREKDSFKVLTKGKNLRSNAQHFTSLQTLYSITGSLLATRQRRLTDGWHWPPKRGKEPNLQIRPDEEILDDHYEELANCWDAILMALPDLKCSGETMRRHALALSKPGEFRDHLLFWPIGQEFLLAPLVRQLLDAAFPQTGRSSVGMMADSLAPMNRVPWDMHGVPWRHFLLVQEKGKWKMRNEERKVVLHVAQRLLQWMVGLDALSRDEVADLRRDWTTRLIRPDMEEADMWRAVEEIREGVLHVGNA